MTIDCSGLDAKLSGCDISISVSSDEPLLKLGNLIDWESLYKIVFPDLTKTKAGAWNVGRKLPLRTHLGALILQAMFNETERETDRRLKYDALWQVFCGKTAVATWKAPDHTKIETFRSRLSPETHHAVGEVVLRAAKVAGFSSPEWMDVDSTVQEANISYPSDATFMVKVMQKTQIVAQAITAVSHSIFVDMKAVKAKAKEYFFLTKNKAIEIRRRISLLDTPKPATCGRSKTGQKRDGLQVSVPFPCAQDFRRILSSANSCLQT